MMALAPIRQAADDLAYTGFREVAETGKPLFDVLAKVQDVATPPGWKGCAR